MLYIDAFIISYTMGRNINVYLFYEKDVFMKKIALFLLASMATQQLMAERYSADVSLYAGVGSALTFAGGVYALARGNAGPLRSLITRMRPSSTYAASKGAALVCAWAANTASLAALYNSGNDTVLKGSGDCFPSYELYAFQEGMFTTQCAISLAPLLPVVPVVVPVVDAIRRLSKK